MNGNVFLVGDAVAGLRPHVAAGTTQAAMHALLLGRVFGKNASMSLDEWQKTTLELSTLAQKAGVSMGTVSQCGDPPPRQIMTSLIRCNTHGGTLSSLFINMQMVFRHPFHKSTWLLEPLIESSPGRAINFLKTSSCCWVKFSPKRI